MTNQDRQKGAARPLWIAVAVVTCVLFGSTINKCLTCFDPGQRVDAAPLPVEDFVMAERGDARRFGTESICFGSMPTPETARYPRLARCVEIFEASASRFATTVGALDDEQIGTVHRWGTHSATVPDLVARMATHNGTHCGQIVDLRRALGMSGIF